MTPWKAIADLEARIATIEDALGALEMGGSFRDPTSYPIFRDFYDKRQARLKAEKQAKKKAPEVNLEPVQPPSIRCHPGLHCTAWPECEVCGPPRL